MKELRNNFDDSIHFDDLKIAKRYYKPTEELFLIEKHKKYSIEIEESKTLEELADVLNRYTDICDNGSHYYIYEW